MNKIKSLFIFAFLSTIFPLVTFASESNPYSRVKSRWAFSLNYPGLALKYGFSNRLALDLHGQFTLGDQNIIAAGPRLWLYLNPTSPVILYLAGEANYVSFESEMVSQGMGGIGAGFLGLEVFLGSRISFLAEIGVGQIYLKDQATSLSYSNSHTVANFGLNFYTQSLREKEEKRKRKEEEAIEILAEEEKRLTKEEERRNQEAKEHFNAGKDAYKRGDFETAIQKFKLVLQLKPDSEPARNLLEEAERQKEKESKKKAEQEARRLREEEAKRKAEERARIEEVEKLKQTGRLTVAVANFEARDPVSPVEATTITDFLRGDLVRLDAFNIVERSSMQEILMEQKFQMTGCSDQECAIEIGKILNVQVMIVGSCTKLFGEFVIVIRVVNVETAKIIFSKEISCRASVEEVQRATAQLARDIETALTR